MSKKDKATDKVGKFVWNLIDPKRIGWKKFCIIMVIPITAIIILGVVANEQNKQAAEKRQQEETQKQEQIEAEKKENEDKLLQSEATMACQFASTSYASKVTNHKFGSAGSNANPYYEPIMDEYDKDGNQLALYRWREMDKSDNTYKTFICWVSGKGSDWETYTVHSLQLEGIQIMGNANFQKYNKDGKAI